MDIKIYNLHHQFRPVPCQALTGPPKSIHHDLGDAVACVHGLTAVEQSCTSVFATKGSDWSRSGACLSALPILQPMAHIPQLFSHTDHVALWPQIHMSHIAYTAQWST